MKKKNILNLIKYHVDENEPAFKQEAYEIADFFDRTGYSQLAEYIMSLLAGTNVYSPQSTDEIPNIQKSDTFFNEETYEFISEIPISNSELYLPESVSNELEGVINALTANRNISTFLLTGEPGTGKTEAVKHIARILNKRLFFIDFNRLIDSKLGQTSKNISNLFKNINSSHNLKTKIFLFDEIDAIASNRSDQNEIKEMGRVTSTLLKEFDFLNEDVLIFATTNLSKYLDSALLRRFDAIINFDKYTNSDLKDISILFLKTLIKQVPSQDYNEKIFVKIISLINNIPSPANLKNIINRAILFSDNENPNDYLIRLFDTICELNNKKYTKEELAEKDFSVREIALLTGESKSSVHRKLKGVV